MSWIKQEIFLCGRTVVYGLMRTWDRITGRYNPVVILCYHALSRDNWRYSTDPDLFMDQIRAIKKEGYEFVSLLDLERFLVEGRPLPERAAVLNFDDGYRDILTLRDFIRQESLKPSLFVLSQSQSADWDELGSKREFLSWNEIRSLANEGWMIGSHGATHASVLSLDSAACQSEIVGSRTEISRQLGMDIRFFAYPKGAYTQAALDAVHSAGYTLALSMDDGIIRRDSFRFALPRVGVDRTHTLGNFRTLYSPSVVWARGVVKRWLGWSGLRKPSTKFISGDSKN